MAVRLWFLHIKLEFAHIHGNHNGKVGGSIAIVWATYFAVIYMVTMITESWTMDLYSWYLMILAFET